MLAFHVAAGIVMAVAFLGICHAACVHRARIAHTALRILVPVAAPIWRHKVATLCVTLACSALIVLAMIRSDARRGVLSTYYASKYHSLTTSEDWKKPSPFLKDWNK